MTDRIEIRRSLRPGDPEAIVALHQRLYPREHGVDSDFVAMVEAAVDAAVENGWPGPREAVWIVEREGEFAGCLGLTDEGDDVAVLRWFLLEPQLRGRGLGGRLLAELLAKAGRESFQRVRLETFSDLRAAANLYRAHGFEVVRTEAGPRWGREQIAYQHYVLELPRPAETPSWPRPRRTPEPQSTSTTAPPRRGSPPPSSLPSGPRATACTPPK